MRDPEERRRAPRVPMAGRPSARARTDLEILPGSTLRLVFQTRQGPLEVEERGVWSSATDGTISHSLAFGEAKGRGFFAALIVAQNR